MSWEQQSWRSPVLETILEDLQEETGSQERAANKTHKVSTVKVNIVQSFFQLDSRIASPKLEIHFEKIPHVSKNSKKETILEAVYESS